jgi:RimJ/RimL family protein N-acetyltransferase
MKIDSTPYFKEFIREHGLKHVDTSDSILYNGKIDGIIVSQCLIMYDVEYRMHIHYIFTPEAYRNKGYAEILLNGILSKWAHVQYIDAQILCRNYSSRKLFNKLGFIEEYIFEHNSENWVHVRKYVVQHNKKLVD